MAAIQPGAAQGTEVARLVERATPHPCAPSRSRGSNFVEKHEDVVGCTCGGNSMSAFLTVFIARDLLEPKSGPKVSCIFFLINSLRNLGEEWYGRCSSTSEQTLFNRSPPKA